MRAFQTGGCLSAVVTAILIAESLLTRVKGDGSDSEEKLDIKYVLIGAGIGLLLVALFIIGKVCIIRKHVHDNTEASSKRPSAPHLFAPGHLSQSENPEAAASGDIQC
ncbi:hypothetical protein Q5P01_023854 [Channa striata]|uniref:Transmembrane protein 273 n=1 Tax=Channa striata TaxID=64152 RepID=A0AA88LP27_CHASR|nr:hypothetical protein Q5P01_023854 [Channa striata]